MKGTPGYVPKGQRELVRIIDEQRRQLRLQGRGAKVLRGANRRAGWPRKKT